MSATMCSLETKELKTSLYLIKNDLNVEKCPW